MAVFYASARFIQHNFRALSIHVVPPTDSRIYHAVVVLDAGFRIYLQVGQTHSSNPSQLMKRCCVPNKGSFTRSALTS